MFSRAFAQTALVLVLALQVHGHAAVAPVLGVSGNPVRGDVKRPNGINPCGAGVNIASEFDASTAAPADATGSFNGVVFNFNKLLDGSRQVSAAVDPTGTGASFTPITVTTNGDKLSKDLGSQPIVAQLPAGTTCTGGATGNKCLVQFKNLSGFGNCMVVSQDSSSNSTDDSSTTVDSTSTATDSADISTSTSDISTDSSVFSTASITDDAFVTATATAAAVTATATAIGESASAATENDEGSAIAKTSKSNANAAANIAGNNGGLASGIKGKVAGKLAGLKSKLQGAAKVPGTRAARSLLAELAENAH